MIDFSGVGKQEKLLAVTERLDYLGTEISEKCLEYGIDELLVKSGQYRHGLESPFTYHEQLEVLSKQYFLANEEFKNLEK